MPRLFTGLELPRVVADQLALLQGGLHGARWIDRDNFHITLRFIGDVDHTIAREVVSALDRVRHGPITLTLDGLGSFGGNKPHSVFVRIAPTQELADLQGEQERIMQRLGLKPERRTFIPHITLARCRGLQPGAVAHWLVAARRHHEPFFRGRPLRSLLFARLGGWRALCGGRRLSPCCLTLVA
jgi:2'-5' RNA ligase